MNIALFGVYAGIIFMFVLHLTAVYSCVMSGSKGFDRVSGGTDSEKLQELLFVWGVDFGSHSGLWFVARQPATRRFFCSFLRPEVWC